MENPHHTVRVLFLFVKQTLFYRFANRLLTGRFSVFVDFRTVADTVVDTSRTANAAACAGHTFNKVIAQGIVCRLEQGRTAFLQTIAGDRTEVELIFQTQLDNGLTDRFGQTAAAGKSPVSFILFIFLYIVLSKATGCGLTVIAKKVFACFVHYLNYHIKANFS